MRAGTPLQNELRELWALLNLLLPEVPGPWDVQCACMMRVRWLHASVWGGCIVIYTCPQPCLQAPWQNIHTLTCACP